MNDTNFQSTELNALGWNDTYWQSWADMEFETYVPGRVIADRGSNYKVAIPRELNAEVSGKWQHRSGQREMPRAGDWVSVQVLENGHAIIHAVLPRKSEISRRQPGEQYAKQVLAANVDLAFLVQALDFDFSPERMQRYLFQLRKESVEPIIVLNKADKEVDIDSKLRELADFNVRIIVTSALLQTGINEVAAAIPPGSTAVFLGSSGVGKSTITNVLLGEQRQKTQAIREADSKGRHTTTHRELFVLPNGGLVIDTPGLRELQLWGTEDDLVGVFGDIDELAQRCKFNDCSHTGEPGCAVTEALRAGALESVRLESYFKLQKELRDLDTKVDEAAAQGRKQSHKKSQKQYNQMIRDKIEGRGSA